jgi:tetratricopeptide (TPR) repeat protein
MIRPFDGRYARRALRIVTLVAACCLRPAICFGGGTPGTPQLSPLVREADDYYLGRWQIANVEKGLDLLWQDVRQRPDDYEAWWRIAEFDCYLDRNSDGPGNLRILEQGIDAGKKATALDPNRPEGHFWLGADYGLDAEEKGLLEGLRMVGRIREQMETVEKLDPNYQECGAQRTLARVDYRVPFFAGGDKRRSVELLEGCLKKYPHDSLTMLYLAESLLALGHRVEARNELQQILQLCPDPNYGPEQKKNQARAQALLAKEFGLK